jgi:hypothetical protein
MIDPLIAMHLSAIIVLLKLYVHLEPLDKLEPLEELEPL